MMKTMIWHRCVVVVVVIVSVDACYDRGITVYHFWLKHFVNDEAQLKPLQLETRFSFSKLLGISIGRVFGALKGL